MKSLMYKLLSIGVAVGFIAGCHPKASEEDAVLFAIASQQITGLAEGNCAISINHAGLTYGVYVNVAINNGGLEGISFQLAGVSEVGVAAFTGVAQAQNIELFTQANYEAASGSTIAEQGFPNYASVPYNLKYDAFFTERGAWTAAKRNALLNYSKTFVDSFQIMAGFNTNTASSIVNSVVTGDTTRKAIFDAFVQAFIVGVYGGGNPNTAGSNLGNSNACFASNAFQAVIGGNPTTCHANIAATSFWPSVLGTDPGPGPLRVNVVITTLAQAMGAVGLQSAVNGTAALACARIPRANCSVRALTTADQKTDIEDAKAVKKTLLSNPLCALNVPTELNFVNVSLFNGAPKDVQIANGVPTPVFFSTTSAIGAILGEKMYPKFGTLVNLGFGNLMPIQSGSRAFELDAEKYVRGANLNATVVSSCESIGITKGFSNVKDLSPVSEVVYAFSDPGKAATIFAAAAGVGSSRAVACNSSFRRIVNENLPLALQNAGVQIDTNVVAGFGNGGVTDTLGLCVYGGNATQRTAARTLIGSGLGIGASNVNECDPSKALSVVRANRFGDPGVKTFKANDANNAIDGE